MSDIAAIELQQALDDITTLTEHDLRVIWDLYYTGNNDQIRDILLELVPEIVNQYGGLAASLSADWYVDLDPSSDFEPKPIEPPPPAQVQANVRWALSPLFQPSVDVPESQQVPLAERERLALSNLTGSAQKSVADTGRGTISASVQEEPGARWYRHASSNACPWCRVLATRDAVYRSERAAMKSHDWCNCVPAVVRPHGDPYTRPSYVDAWEAEYIAARKEVGGDLDDIVNFLRRQDRAAS